MRLETNTEPPERIGTPLMVVLVASDRPWSERAVPDELPELAALDRLAGEALSRAAAAGDFQGRARDRALGHGRGERGPERVLFQGVGSTEALTPERLRVAAGKAVRAAEHRRVRSLALCLRCLD
ncbi:MAG: hypothetical protein F4Z50_04670, partial [Gemmatimonadetes bacterium]|nr:hypothetical protein [Gemmatimonadota bacterium]